MRYDVQLTSTTHKMSHKEVSILRLHIQSDIWNQEKNKNNNNITHTLKWTAGGE